MDKASSSAVGPRWGPSRADDDQNMATKFHLEKIWRAKSCNADWGGVTWADEAVPSLPM